MIQAALQNAAVRLQQGDAAGALAQLDAVDAPGHPDHLHLRALALSRLGRMQEARGDFERAAACHPDPATVLINYANALRREGNQTAARAAYERAAERAPHRVDAVYGAGLCCADLGDTASARRAFEQVLSLKPDHTGALNALGLLDKAAGAQSDAEARFSQCLAKEPHNVACLINRGALRGFQGRSTEALADLETACRLQPGSAEAQFQRASVLRSSGRNEEALEAYDLALQSAPLRADIHADRAGLAHELGLAETMLSAIDAVLAIRPDLGLLATRAYLASRAGRHDEAIASAEQAVTLAPTAAYAWESLGGAKRSSGDVEGAIAAFRKGLTLAPERFESRHGLADALLGSHRFDDALQVLDVAAPDQHLQRHTALQALGWRAVGDPRYAEVYDYDRFVVSQPLETPPGYASLDAFNAELAAAVETLHATTVEPIGQTLFGGTQSPGRLWQADHPVIRALGAALLEAGARYALRLGFDRSHPFLRRNTGSVSLAGAWSVRLRSGGGHVDHMHPAGWVSASYYVQVPESVRASGGDDRRGCIRFGASGVAGLDLPAERWVRPEPGLIVFFPSYMWHGVEPFESDQVRVTTPFDLVPTVRSDLK